MSSSIRGMQPRDFVGPLLGTQRARAPARQVIDGGHAALVMQFAHEARRGESAESFRRKPF